MASSAAKPAAVGGDADAAGHGSEVAARGCAAKPSTPRHVAMNCARRLKVIASIEDPAVIARIVTQLDRTSGTSEPELAPPLAAPGRRRFGRRCCEPAVRLL